jgi:menaquinone-dependent protoporphyrinogen IX oxidase
MKALVIYDSVFGNTEKIAQTIPLTAPIAIFTSAVIQREMMIPHKY